MVCWAGINATCQTTLLDHSFEKLASAGHYQLSLLLRKLRHYKDTDEHIVLTVGLLRLASSNEDTCLLNLEENQHQTRSQLEQVVSSNKS